MVQQTNDLPERGTGTIDLKKNSKDWLPMANLWIKMNGSA
jgi:hypothetical protein